MRSTLLILFILFALFISRGAKAQEPLKHEKKIYKAENGTLYANKDLPIYFRISTSRDADAESYLLMPDEGSKKYANPMYFDTEGYNSFRSPSKVDTVSKKIVYPIEDIIYEIYSDSQSPITKFSFENKNYHKKDSIYYFGEKIELKLDARDATSGVDVSYFSMDKQAYQKLSAPIELNQEKLYHIQYYSVDHVGNAEKPKSIYIKIDLSKPTTRLIADPDLYKDILSPRSRITLEAQDENSKVKKTVFSINGGASYNYTKPIVLSGLKEGEHSLSYYSVDHVGNQEAQKEYIFYLDKTPPMIVDELVGNTFIANGKEYSSGRSRIKLTAMDNKAGVKEIRYSINDGEFIEYTKPFYLSKSGKLKIQTFVSDQVNNQKINLIMTNKSIISYVDLSGPSLGHQFKGESFVAKDTAYITSETQISLAAKDDASGFKKMEYSIDNDSIKSYTKPFKVNKEGIHAITYTGYDNVDNSSTNTFICVEDNTGPEIFFRFSILSDKTKGYQGKTYDLYPNHAVLFLSSTDSLVGFNSMSYSINGAPDKAYTSLIRGFQSNKLYSIKVTSIDKLGNKSQKDINFYIE